MVKWWRRTQVTLYLDQAGWTMFGMTKDQDEEGES